MVVRVKTSKGWKIVKSGERIVVSKGKTTIVKKKSSSSKGTSTKKSSSSKKIDPSKIKLEKNQFIVRDKVVQL